MNSKSIPGLILYFPILLIPPPWQTSGVFYFFFPLYYKREYAMLGGERVEGHKYMWKHEEDSNAILQRSYETEMMPWGPTRIKLSNSELK